MDGAAGRREGGYGEDAAGKELHIFDKNNKSQTL